MRERLKDLHNWFYLQIERSFQNKVHFIKKCVLRNELPGKNICLDSLDYKIFDFFLIGLLRYGGILNFSYVFFF